MSDSGAFIHLLQERWRRLTLYGASILEAFEFGPYSHLYDRVHSLEQKVEELKARLEPEAEATPAADPTGPETTQRRNSASS